MREAKNLAGVKKNIVEIVLLHPVLQVADPKRADLVGGGGLGVLGELRSRSGHMRLRGPHGRCLGSRRWHHHVGLRGLLAILLGGLLAQCRRSHTARTRLHHHVNVEREGEEREIP